MARGPEPDAEPGAAFSLAAGRSAFVPEKLSVPEKFSVSEKLSASE
jgi:hypothetical protein